MLREHSTAGACAGTQGHVTIWKIPLYHVKFPSVQVIISEFSWESSDEKYCAIPARSLLFGRWNLEFGISFFLKGNFVLRRIRVPVIVVNVFSTALVAVHVRQIFRDGSRHVYVRRTDVRTSGR